MMFEHVARSEQMDEYVVIVYPIDESLFETILVHAIMCVEREREREREREKERDIIHT